MNLRNPYFPLCLIAICLLVLSSCALLPKATAPSPSQPNVLIILADDLGWADVGYRGSDIRTPNLDQLAADGLRLERFYTNPICTPTRAALMTGRDPLKLGVAYAGLQPWEAGGISLEEHFMPESFKAAGYQTAMVGKWHLGRLIEQHTPNARGFDHFVGHLNTQVNYYDHTVAGGKDLQENGESIERDGRYLTDVHGEEAVRYIEALRSKDQPFFLYLPFLAPHSPVQAPDDIKALYPDRADRPLPRKTYAAMVDSMDRAIGNVLQALDDEAIAENTLVLFLSDNGGYKNFGASNAPLRGGKLSGFEGGIRVNAVMRWPGKVPAGKQSSDVVSVQDVFPTLATATGVTRLTEKAIDGQDRWQAILSEQIDEREGPMFFASNSPVYNLFSLSVIDGNMKLVQEIDHQNTNTTIKNYLFDLSQDPNEKNNLMDAQPEQVERLAGMIDDWRAQHPVGGQFVSISPHPGWRAPKDYALAVTPAEDVIEQPWQGFGKRASGFLQKTYGKKGKIEYE